MEILRIQEKLKLVSVECSKQCGRNADRKYTKYWKMNPFENGAALQDSISGGDKTHPKGTHWQRKDPRKNAECYDICIHLIGLTGDKRNELTDAV